jgi:transposase-like protein
MESTPPEGEEVHTLAPANLPAELVPDPPVRPSFAQVRKLFDRPRKVAIVAELLSTGITAEALAEKVSAQCGWLITVSQVQGWRQAYAAEARLSLNEVTPPTKRAAAMSTEPTPSPLKGRTRRIISDKEKILFVVRWKKLKTSLVQGSKQLGVSESALGKWVKAFEKLNPRAKGGLVNSATSSEHLSDEIKIATLKKIAAGQRPSELARELKVHASSLKNWWTKYRPKERWPKQPTTRPSFVPSPFSRTGESKKGAARNVLDTRAADGIARVTAGELISDVAKDLKVGPGTVRNWWQAINGNKKWPSQYLGRMSKEDFRKTRGSQKKTRDRISVREAVLSNSRALTAQTELLNAPEELNGALQPIATGKAMHDILVFLQLARDEWAKEIKAGNVRVDYAPMLYTMLALHRAGK